MCLANESLPCADGHAAGAKPTRVSQALLSVLQSVPSPAISRSNKVTLFKRNVGVDPIFLLLLSGVRLSPLGTAANTGLLYQPQMIDHGDFEALTETEVLGENLLQRHFAHHKSHMIRPVLEPEPPRWKTSD
jgi:hypothetical protein